MRKEDWCDEACRTRWMTELLKHVYECDNNGEIERERGWWPKWERQKPIIGVLASFTKPLFAP